MKYALGLFLSVFVALIFAPAAGAPLPLSQGIALAAPVGEPPNQTKTDTSQSAKGTLKADDCIKVAVKIDGKDCVNNLGEGGAIVEYIKIVAKFIFGLVGLVIILMLVIAGIQYIVSAGDPAAIKSAKNRITNALTALLLFLMFFAIFRFLIPGNILS